MDLARLQEQEAIIKAEFGSVIRAGQALWTIKQERLFLAKGFQTFEDYMQTTWPALPPATKYYELGVAQVRSVLSDDITAAHANTLKRILKKQGPGGKLELDEDLVRDTWHEIEATGPDVITADYVERVAKKQWLMKNSGDLGVLVANQSIAPDKAYRLQEILSKLPDQYTLAVLEHGINAGECVSADTIRAIQALSYQNKLAADEVLASGHLQNIPLWQLTPQDVKRYQNWLIFEEKKAKQLKVIEAQKQALAKSNSRIFDSVGAWQLEEAPLLYFLFANGLIEPAEIFKFIEHHNLKVFFVALYDPANPPQINFNGEGVAPDKVEVKPQPLMDYIEKATI